VSETRPERQRFGGERGRKRRRSADSGTRIDRGKQMRAQGQDREKRRQEQEEKHDRTGFEFALAHLSRDGGYRRLILWRSHEGSYEQIAYRPVEHGRVRAATIATERFWQAGAYTCTIRIWVQRLEES